MNGDDLHKPLGLDLDADREVGREIPWNMVGYGGLGVLAAGLMTFAWLTDNGMGGEPFAVASIQPAPKSQPIAPAPVAAAPVASTEDATASIRVTSAGRTNAADIENASGVKVVRQGGGSVPGALIIQVPQKLGIELTPAPDRRLVEKAKYGPIPKISADGSRPLDVYARPIVTSLTIKPGAPRIAIVVGGMGLSATATRLALEKLPGDVTFAFAPYGADLERQAAKARADGHETILQLPMEAFEGADMNGARTLETSLTPDQLMDRLHWHLSRFSGYVGVENFLGQRFTAREEAIAPVMREMAKRGLLYLDDGSSPTSVAPAVGATVGAVNSRADVVIDAERAPEAIGAALLKLEAIAREKGYAIGTMSALPATVEQTAKFIDGLEKRGVALAPLSAVVKKAPGPSASVKR
jgi:polysaccharide deacetylase 2 family uncharacterized protein YibQ